MLSKNNIKFINSLKKKKYRQLNKQFVVEGDKMVEEALCSEYMINQLITTEEWISKNENKIKNSNVAHIVKDSDLNKISSFKTPNEAFAVLKIPDVAMLNSNVTEESLLLGFEDIQDPGNLGTIIRTADWFGINKIICSKNCVDLYNPKVIQATMGSIFRVQVIYTDLIEFLKKCNKINIYGTSLDGNNIYEENISEHGIIVFGNESKGISKELNELIENKLFIPGFSTSNTLPESLNISTSVAIVCSEFKRRLKY